MYHKSWDKRLTLTLDEYSIPLPDMCEERTMTNYFLSKSQQKFKYEELPDFRTMNMLELENYAEKMWHIREHGQWQLINGQPYYIPGGAWFFFNFWTTTRGKRPDFRLEALEFFWFWYLFVEPNPKIMGMLLIKARRMGDSEKALSILYERSTRYFNYPGGIQSYTDEEAAKAFHRLVRAYNKMPFFFKPKISGSPTEELKFYRPAEPVTLKKLKDKREEVIEQSDGEFLDSSISFRATVNLAYDGSMLGTWIQDECFKIPKFKMDLKAQIENIKRVISLNNGMTLVGKMMCLSTVEEKSNDIDASTVAMAEELWDGSDWNDLDDNGSTRTGMVRIFRGYEKNAQIDEFGIPKVEEARKHRANRVKALMAAGDEEGLLSLKRKEPEVVQDAFAKPTTNCPLHPKLCEARLIQLKEGLDRYGNKAEKHDLIIGNLQWKDRNKTEVEFIRRNDGRWQFSQFPFRENAISKRGSRYVPLNQPFYRMGVDPYDSDVVIAKGSDGAFSIFRKFYLPHEDTTKLKFNEMGEVENVWDMKTNQFVCAYKYRHQDPEDFFEDCILTAFYFGCQMYVEIDKPGLTQWVRKNYKGFLQFEPDELINALAGRNKKREGSKTTQALVGNYVGLLSAHISKYIWAEKIPMIINQWMYFETAKRTKFDLAVATGWSMIADMDDVKEKEENKTWGANSFYLN